MVLAAGRDAGIPDGQYTVSLTATDRAGWSSEARASIVLDNTPPEIKIEPLGENGVVTGPDKIVGSVVDRHLLHYRAEYAVGACDAASEWMPVGGPVAAGGKDVLAAFDALPADGDYCLRVTAEDRVGNRSAKTQRFTVDTRLVPSRADTGMSPPADLSAPVSVDPGCGSSGGAEASVEPAVAAGPPVVKVQKSLACPVNLLVWVNDGCRVAGESERADPGCMPTDLLSSMLAKMTDGWNMVYGKDEFAAELSNPIYSDILIIGDRCRPAEPAADALAQKIFSGAGLVSTLWTPRQVKGSGETALYGSGAAAIVPLDLDQGFDDGAFDAAAHELTAAVGRVHRTRPPQVFLPKMMIPIQISLENPGEEVGVRVTERFPAGCELYDPAAGAWTMESPWTADVKLAPGEILHLLYYLRVPDVAGRFSTETSLLVENGAELTDREHMNVGFTVVKNDVAQTIPSGE